ncbi:MAG: hypothetical protein ACK5KT_03840 [Dysgonomonas sp.]
MKKTILLACCLTIVCSINAQKLYGNLWAWRSCNTDKWTIIEEPFIFELGYNENKVFCFSLQPKESYPIIFECTKLVNEKEKKYEFRGFYHSPYEEETYESSNSKAYLTFSEKNVTIKKMFSEYTMIFYINRYEK